MASINRLRNTIRADQATLTAVSSSVSGSNSGFLFLTGSHFLLAADPASVHVSQSEGTNGCTASLPASPGSTPLEYTVKDAGGHAASRVLIVSGNAPSQLIDGVATVTLNHNYGFVTVQWNPFTTSWHVMNISGSTNDL